MVYLQFPLRRGKRPVTTLAEDETSKGLRVEAGLRNIKGTEDLASRIKFVDEFFSNVVDNMQRQLDQFVRKPKKTKMDLEQMKILNEHIVNFEAYRATKKSAMAWSIAGEDPEMSKKYSAFETFFTRNWQNPWEAKKIMRFSQYLLDLSFKNIHVEPAPQIVVQSLPSGHRISFEETKPKTEEIE